MEIGKLGNDNKKIMKIISKFLVSKRGKWKKKIFF